MDDIPLSALSLTLIVLLALSAFFSLSETAMMASNRFRLRHLANKNHQGALLATQLLDKTDKMLGVILLGNNLINSAAATLVSLITIELFGEEKWALGVGTLAVTFAILVFSEITPKIIGATYADKLVLVLGYILTPLLRVFYPLVWFINLFADTLLKLLRLKKEANGSENNLTPEELRSLVLESSQLIPHKHRSILDQLFDLHQVTAEDLMTPRGQIEILDISEPWDKIREQIATSHHSRAPVCHESLDQLIGVLSLRRTLSLFEHTADKATTVDNLLQLTQPPYYIPAATPAFNQLAFFQENKQRIGFVVDEYGEILGLLTLEDIIEEFVGDFTTSVPERENLLHWDEDRTCMIEGGRNVRDINRQLALTFPTNGPKTLNGLILDHLQDIPESGVSIKLHDTAIEILKTEDRSVVMARVFKPEQQ